MTSFDKIKNAIIDVDEETTIEEMRGILAGIVETIPEVDDDITALTSEVETLKSDIEVKKSEIDKLKTENGRLFRERVSNIVESEVEEIDEKEKEYTRDELDKMFREFE